MKNVTTVCALLALTGCASSGPIPIGPDTYLINKQSAGGVFVTAGAVKADLLRESMAFCSSQNKQMLIVSTQELGAIPLMRTSSAEVQFMCLNQGDPRLAQGTLQRGPDQIIETRNR